MDMGNVEVVKVCWVDASEKDMETIAKEVVRVSKLGYDKIVYGEVYGTYLLMATGEVDLGVGHISHMEEYFTHGRGQSTLVDTRGIHVHLSHP